MKRWMGVALAAVICLSGCNLQKTEGGEAVPQNTQAAQNTPQPPRKDVLGNPIETGYAEGALVENKAGTIKIKAEEGEKLFFLSKRAETDFQALQIKAGDRIIVNFEPMEDGRYLAVSLEKIIEE